MEVKSWICKISSKKWKWKVKSEKWILFQVIARYWTFKMEYFQLETFRAKMLQIVFTKDICFNLTAWICVSIYKTIVLKICWNQDTLVLNESSYYCVQAGFVLVFDDICACIYWHGFVTSLLVLPWYSKSIEIKKRWYWMQLGVIVLRMDLYLMTSVLVFIDMDL